MSEQNPEQAYQVTEQAPPQDLHVEQGGAAPNDHNVEEVQSPGTEIQQDDMDSTPDPEADATQDDDKVEQTDNSPTEEDGDQSNVSQEATDEDSVQVEESNDGESAS